MRRRGYAIAARARNPRSLTYEQAWLSERRYTGSMTDVRLRPARVGEHAQIVAIDEQAAVLFERVGISFAHLSAEHPFVRNEHRRWFEALQAGGGWIATIGQDVAGFMILSALDGEPYLDQLSVLPEFMRRGVGRTLIAHACALSASQPRMSLTTYGHLAWNRPYYERFGFEPTDEADCGPELKNILAEQRTALPLPEQRIAMRKRLIR